MHILTKPPEPVTIEPHRTFPSFQDAWDYTAGCLVALEKAGQPVVAAQAWTDLFERFRPKGIIPQVLGITRATVRKCEQLSAGGSWTIHHSAWQTGGHQFLATYSRYLPYAVGMMECENGFEYLGIDHQTVIALHGTVMGFVDIGLGENAGHDEADRAFYDELYSTACKVCPPSLPFDEAYNPACAFVYIHAPKLFTRLRDKDGHCIQKVSRILDACIVRLAKLPKAA